MAKKYDASNTGKTGGKAHSNPKVAPKKAPCSTCGGNRTVRVSKPRIDPHQSPARQQYDIVTERCPAC